MKKIILIIFTLFFFSCANLERNRMETFESMKPPIIVFAKSDAKITETSRTKATIILIDSLGQKVIFDEEDDIGPALIESYNFRDTLINLK